jgi:hypothetical protein
LLFFQEYYGKVALIVSVLGNTGSPTTPRDTALANVDVFLGPESGTTGFKSSVAVSLDIGSGAISAWSLLNCTSELTFRGASADSSGRVWFSALLPRNKQIYPTNMDNAGGPSYAPALAADAAIGPFGSNSIIIFGFDSSFLSLSIFLFLSTLPRLKPFFLLFFSAQMDTLIKSVATTDDDNLNIIGTTVDQYQGLLSTPSLFFCSSFITVWLAFC